MTPTAPANETIKSQTTIFDLKTMDEVTVFKTKEFVPVANATEFNDRIKNDAARFLEIVNKGLRAEELSALTKDSSLPWMEEDDNGNVKPFEGTPADRKAVNGLRLNLAKSIFAQQYAKDAKTAKEAAMNLIKTTPAMVEGLKASAGLIVSDNSEGAAS